MRLVLDSDYPVPRTSNPPADYGTLLHFATMTKQGLNPPPPKDFELIEANALSLYRNSPTLLSAAIDCSSELAMTCLPKLTGSARWVPELRKHDDRLLPERRSREGHAGYGGLIDLMASDRSILVDFKFVSKLPDKVKLSYLWQMASYHIVTGVPKCMLLFTARPDKDSLARVAAKYGGDPMKTPLSLDVIPANIRGGTATCIIDFTLPLWKKFAEGCMGRIHSIGHADFRRSAYFAEGDQCTYCVQKERCPLVSNKLRIEATSSFVVPTKIDPLMAEMERLLKVSAANSALPMPTPTPSVPKSSTVSPPTPPLF
jgi:hypothetical protein